MKLCYELFLFIICVQVMSPARNITDFCIENVCECVTVYVNSIMSNKAVINESPRKSGG